MYFVYCCCCSRFLNTHSLLPCEARKIKNRRGFAIYLCISLLPLTADGPQRARLPIPCTYCNVATLPVVSEDLAVSPRFSPTIFYRDASSALLHPIYDILFYSFLGLVFALKLQFIWFMTTRLIILRNEQNLLNHRAPIIACGVLSEAMRSHDSFMMRELLLMSTPTR